MKTFNYGCALSDSKSRPCLCSLFVVASLICGAYFISSAPNSEEYKEVCISAFINSTEILLGGTNMISAGRIQFYFFIDVLEVNYGGMT
ncbi:hypothetical protein SLEP1_g12670 [Rubroshorea leprosula]|uniref:Uncharacterized protein n=1 Tax=Rubroshorea leprosula TaxID=152421 RepID=A0AAV5IJB1_9ROSI|nr:hypothetical protein SLEP1_g12670 [Rubroshorea leprosula]